jgi:hypothetical protein
MLLSAFLCAPAFAAKKNDKPGWEDWDRWNIDVGVFSATQDTTVRLDATDGTVGTLIDLEDNLGLDSRVSDPRIDVLWRYKKRSSVSLSYFKLERDSVGPLSITIKFGDIILDPATTSDVRTVYDIGVISAQWGYSFFRTPKWDARFTIGIFAMDIFASLQDPADPVKQDQGDVLAPLPVLGMGFDHKLTGKWHLSGGFRYFSLEYEDKYSGNLTEALVGATHHTFKNVGFGIAYNYMNLDIDSTDEDFSGLLNIRYKGPFAYVRVRLGPGR